MFWSDSTAGLEGMSHRADQPKAVISQRHSHYVTMPPVLWCDVCLQKNIYVGLFISVLAM